MNTSRNAMEWLICFSIVHLMLGCLLFKKLKKFKPKRILTRIGPKGEPMATPSI